MDDVVAVYGRRVREWRLWAALGIVGVLFPIVIGPLAALAVLFPPLMLALVGLLARQGRRVRGTLKADSLRWWTVDAWAIFTAIWVGVVIWVLTPDGTAPTGAAAVATLGVIVGGSMIIALGSHAFARRWLAGKPQPV